MENYYELPALSNTALGWLKKSPFHCKAFLDGKIKKDTSSMKLGRHLHAGLLTPNLQTFVGCNQNSNKGKEQAKEYEKQGLTVVTEKEYEIIVNCIQVLQQDQEIKELLAGAECEKPVLWEMQGVKCKGLVDIFNPNFKGKKKRILADLKFMQDAHPKEVYKKATYVYDYDRQMDWYVNGLASIGIEIDEVWIIACEKESPYAYSINKFHIGSEFMLNGQEKWNTLFDLYLETIHKGIAPSYGTVEYDKKEVLTLSNGQAIDFSKIDTDAIINLLS